MGHLGTHISKSWASQPRALVRWTLVCFVVFATNMLWGNQNDIDFGKFIEVIGTQYGPHAKARGVAWRDELSKLRSADVQEQLTEVNKFFNRRVNWHDDANVYGREDFWATPGEMLGRGEGDCEDYTIAKYVSLRNLGIPAEQLRLTYVRLKVTTTLSQSHMVLAWYPEPNSTPLILDNVNPRILPASQRRDLKPIFSFNSGELWLGNSRSATSASPSARISQWRQMIARAEKEGIVL